MKMTKGGFDILRKSFGKLSQSQVGAINFIVEAMDKDKSITYPQEAYILATTWHETATTMAPERQPELSAMSVMRGRNTSWPVA